ncbi:MAG: amino acid ABC transporter permease [Clostridiales bacterium]|nr:amino acid ABC transporter permease [Clostridiales bacterium]
MSWFEAFAAKFHQCFVQDGRFANFMLSGLKVTLQITFSAAIISISLGSFLAIVRVTHDKNIAAMYPGSKRIALKAFNQLCKLCITVVRGIPMVVQLMIWFFVVFAASRNALGIAILAFGINSAVYTAEIVRAGIMSVDHGQTEAGRSLGLGYVHTMRFIILPQAFKNVLPALCNEFIVLLKDTAVVGYIALCDLTRGAYLIAGRTYEPFLPLVAAALIYLAMVIVLSKLFGKLERRLRTSDSH